VIAADEVSASEAAGYTVRDFGGQKLAFSKLTDNKPLTTMKLSTSQPCLNPFEQPFSPKKQYLIGEMGLMANSCSPVSSLPGEPQQLDSRYKQVGLTGITQYDLERESGVLDILER